MAVTDTLHINCAYAPRPITFVEVREFGDWKLKLYTITLPGAKIDWSIFQNGLAVAQSALPTPAIGDGRFDVGFVICH